MNIVNIFLLDREKEAEASFSGIKGIEKITSHPRQHHHLLLQRIRSNGQKCSR